MFPPTTKILLIDDSRFRRGWHKKQLGLLGFKTIVEAGDASQVPELMANEAANGKPFQLVVSAWPLFTLKGEDWSNKIRDQEFSKNIPFVIHTTDEMESASTQALLQSMAPGGLADHIMGPYESSVLRRKLELLWENLEDHLKKRK